MRSLGDSILVSSSGELITFERLRQRSFPKILNGLGLAYYLSFGYPSNSNELLIGLRPKNISKGIDNDPYLDPSTANFDKNVLDGESLTQLVRSLEPRIRGRSVGLVLGLGDINQGLLSSLLREIGAVQVVKAGQSEVPLNIGRAQSVAIALTGQPHSDLQSLGDLASAIELAQRCEVILFGWGAENLAERPTNRTIAANGSAAAETIYRSTKSIAGGYLKTGCFDRDIVFEQICLLNDEERLRIAGTVLLKDGFLSMADRYFTNDERLNASEIWDSESVPPPELDWIRARANLASVAADLLGRDVIFPFFRLQRRRGVLTSWKNMATGAALGDFAKILSPDSLIFRCHIVSNNGAFRSMLHSASQNSSRHRAAMFAIVGLEKWLRVIGISR